MKRKNPVSEISLNKETAQLYINAVMDSFINYNILVLKTYEFDPVLINRLVRGVLGLAGVTAKDYDNVITNKNHWLYQQCEEFVNEMIREYSDIRQEDKVGHKQLRQSKRGYY